MTVIVGIPHNDRVYLGGDAQGTGQGSYDIRVEPKVWERDGLVFGSTSSFRAAQILRYRTTLPDLPEDAEDDDALWPWLVNDFVDALREARRAAGSETKFGDGSESGPQFMLGVVGRLFVVDTDYQVYEQPRGFAVGSGSPEARGSLHTSAGFWRSPERRIRAALEAACAIDPSCRPPFTIVKTP